MVIATQQYIAYKDILLALGVHLDRGRRYQNCVDRVDLTDPLINRDTLDFVELRDVDGQLVELGSEAADGDRCFYVWSKSERLLARLGLYWRKTLADVVVDKSDLTDSDTQANLF